MAHASVFTTDIAGPKGDLLFAGNGNAVLTGGIGHDTIYGWGNNDTLTAGTGSAQIYAEDARDVLTGGAGNDTLNGFGANETMVGGSGNNTFIINNATDVVTQQPHTGNDTVLSSVSYVQPENVQNLTLTGSANLIATGNDQAGVLTGNAGNDTLIAGSGNDTLVAGSGIDTLIGGVGDDTFVVNNTQDVIRMAEGTLIGTVDSSVSYTLPTGANVLHLAGQRHRTGVANNGDDLLTANGGRDTLVGGSGMDVLEGGAGGDVLIDHKGPAVLLGGVGATTMNVRTEDVSFLGAGYGRTTITIRALGTVVGFNRGEGVLTFQGHTVGSVLSLGGGIREGALRFTKQGQNLVLRAGGKDRITLRGWYAAPAELVSTLQIIEGARADYAPDSPDELVNHKVVIFNFGRLVTAFNQARAAQPGLTSWTLSHGFVAAYQGGSDTAAIGGDLAYYFGLGGHLTGMEMRAVRAVLLSPRFGTGLQTIHPWAAVSAPGPFSGPILP
ncbi:MAG: calcium-binding protein [Burkholderiales bacterium]